ncbi:type I polyketide synthase [Nocardioides baekrokdamisoli]|nr:type I polyketide synthase [Nocardioides baekrokdamisoli]
MSIAPPLPRTSSTSRTLLDQLASGTPFSVIFGGQGAPWLTGLAELVRTHAVEVGPLVAAAQERTSPVGGELLRSGQRFDPIPWLNALADSESIESDDASAAPSADEVVAPSLSIPGVLLGHIALVRGLRRLGLDPAAATVAIGHSQGRLAVELLSGMDEAEALAYAILIGAAVERTAREHGLLGAGMRSVSGPSHSELKAALAAAPQPSRLEIGLHNGPTSHVVTGPAAELRHLEDLIPGAVIDDLHIGAAYHHSELAAASDLAATWAAACGLDPDAARRLTDSAIVQPTDWAADVATLTSSAATWVLDLGPTDVASRLTSTDARAHGLTVVPTALNRGLRELTVPGGAPAPARSWTAYAPTVVTLPDGSTRAETAFTRLTGRSPILLAGMTPTTVDPAIVAAAANAGFWAELAGGGQVSEEIFAANVDRLGGLLEPGRTWAFNSLLLDPYLWRLQVEGKRLLPRARAAGAAVDGVIVTAGVPELEDAVRLVGDLRAVGVPYVAFKPGTLAQVRDVLAIADEVAPTPLIVQIEGGKAGGHHSWEDLDELLIKTYADLRARENVVVCVGGGIGTPDIAARYITGDWSIALGHPAMPLDGVLIGTAAMACLEATTSPQVKQLLVDTPGTDGWVKAGTARNGMASGHSQLGADIHEIDNTASRVGRLLDEVAGDADAVKARAGEIIEALNQTAKPYFGDAAQMTYAEWLTRFVDLAGTPTWLDSTLRDRFHTLLQRAEARLAPEDHGQIPTLWAESAEIEDGAAAIAALIEHYPSAESVQLHPVDVSFFVKVCRTAGKPVPFVPVLDAEVRRWWRSDSLWQAHDERYDADAVCVIPGPVAIAGITRVDEPVADLLQRFEDAVVDSVLADGDWPARVVGRRRDEHAEDALSLVLAAPDVVWGERTVTNPVHRLGGDWHVVDAARAEQRATGATLSATSPTSVELQIPTGDSAITLILRTTDGTPTGAAPVVEDAAESMIGLLNAMAGQRSGGHAQFHPGLATEHALVTDTGAHGTDAVLDALVGLTWPTVFHTLATRPDVVEGVLDLVHLDHVITGSIPTEPGVLDAEAEIVSVTDTEVGRVVTVDVSLTRGGAPVATLHERFAIRGRSGAARLTPPTAIAPDVRDTPRVVRVSATVTAPTDLHAFAAVTGDHNPLHTSVAVAQLAGLEGPIVHGMWISAVAQRVITEQTDRPIEAWSGQFLAPVMPGQEVTIQAARIGVRAGRELLTVVASVDGTTVFSGQALVGAPTTAYVFPGQGIQHPGMGMEAYGRSKAAREIWDRADAHTRSRLGFSILEVVRTNPTELDAADGRHKHPDGVLFLTQFTQVAMAVLASAQMAELVESGLVVEDAYVAGHSVGEYNALAAVAGVISLEAVVEVVYQRGSVMHRLVPRDAEGRSDYRLAAIRPSQIDLADDDVLAFVETVSAESGEFLQIVNYNLRGSQYAIAGTVAGCKALETEVERRRAAAGGRGAFVLVPGIDVPFHSSVLRAGVPDFRSSLEALLPAEIDPALLLGRYVPNLVARPFSLDEEFLRSILEVAPAEPIEAALADFAAWAARPGALTRLLLVELLAWQFASPVRWIETQDLFFGSTTYGGLGVTQLIEVGVGKSPTLANLASQTLKVPSVRVRLDRAVDVYNLERDAARCFSTDEDVVIDDDEPEAAAPADSAPAAAAPVAAAPAAASANIADLPFTAADATRLLLTWWTKIRADQLAGNDSIEALTDGASSRRNQLLVDLGTELSLGAIDGAAEADLGTLSGQVNALARGYKPFGPVLSVTLADHLKKVLGPAGVRQSAIADRVTGHWQLGAGWAHHVLVEVALRTREGASVRGGDLAAGAAPGNAGEATAIIDAAVTAVAARHGVSVAAPVAESASVDAGALAGITGGITDALVSTAKHLLAKFEPAAVATAEDANDDAALIAHVERELGTGWITATAPAFDAKRAVLLDDRWASVREDIVRIAYGEQDSANIDAAGDNAAAIARWLELDDVASAAETTQVGTWAEDTAIITGASVGSIAAAVAGELLAGGATVIATTSRLDDARLAFFKQLYREHAQVGAKLWVVPANMASFADIDAFVAWVTGEQTTAVGPTTKVTKPALRPTLLLPFAAGSVRGDAADVGPRAEVEARILLWSVERLVTADWGRSLHVVLPGSPNRGRFGGDGAYGEAKAALDALVTRWKAERDWAENVTLAHAIIGWVRGTGLMKSNDPLVEAVEAAGVRTWSNAEMAAELLALCSVAAREKAAVEPLTVDLTGGLDAINLRELAKSVADSASADDEVAAETVSRIDALPGSPADLHEPHIPEWPTLEVRPEDLVVIVGAGELGPYGSSRTRFEVEVSGELSAAGVLELAWTTGLVRWDAVAGSWFDVASDEAVDEAEIFDRYNDAVLERCGVRDYVEDGAITPGSAPLLASVFLPEDLTFTVSSEAEAQAMREANPEHTAIATNADGEWTVTRRAGTEIRVPRRVSVSRTVGGQLPTGFDPRVWGIPGEMVEAIDRVALWNLVCTVDAFLSSGFTPSELMRWVHPARVANTQGTGMGGMTSMQSLYVDTLLGESTANDLLQEALPNVIAAHVMQSYVGGYGAMVHPVAACATTAVSVEEGVDKIRVGKADVVVAGGFDDLSTEGVVGFAAMSATADTEAMRAQGISDRYISRANDRRRGGFVESQGGGTLLLARGDVAARMGLPVLGVVAYAGSYADGIHTSIPAPGLGALSAGLGGQDSMLAKALNGLGLTADDVAVISKHDTSTAANDPNESELHERLADALGRHADNPLLVVSQKSLTGHAKGGAAAFQLIGLCQVLTQGVVPPNRSLDCLDPALEEYRRLVWLRQPLHTGPLRAGLVTSLGFGHVSGLVAVVHPEAFIQSLPADEREDYRARARARQVDGRLRITRAMLDEPAYVRPKGRRLGDAAGYREREAEVLINPTARLAQDGAYACR